MSFNLWSEVNQEASLFLKPDLGLRDWDGLSVEEKKIMWQHLQTYFFIRKAEYSYYGNGDYTNEDGYLFPFFSPYDREKRERITVSIAALNSGTKRKIMHRHI